MQKLTIQKALYDKGLMDMFDALDTRMKYRALSTAGLVVGSTSKKAIKIASTVNFLFNGVFGAKTTAEVAFTATTHDIAAHATLVKEAMYLLSFSDVSGTPVLTMGTITQGAGTAVLPEIPAAHTPVGAVRVAAVAGGAGFDATTTDLDTTAAVTVTYYNLGWLAPRFDAVV